MKKHTENILLCLGLALLLAGSVLKTSAGDHPLTTAASPYVQTLGGYDLPAFEIINVVTAGPEASAEKPNFTKCQGADYSEALPVPFRPAVPYFVRRHLNADKNSDDEMLSPQIECLNKAKQEQENNSEAERFKRGRFWQSRQNA